MNNKFTARIKAWLPSFALMCFFALTFGQARAATTVFTTDSSWHVTSNFFAGWNNNPFTLTSPWVVPGGGNTNCGIAQPGVVGVPKIWFPATNAFRNCYFRKNFSINQLCEVKTAILEIAAADNYVVFINGIPLTSGNATAKTINIPVQLLKCENVIAVQARDINAKCWWMSARVTINTTPYVFTASSNSPATNPICIGQNLNLTATSLAGATYSWTGPNGFISNLQYPTRPNVSLIDTGDYMVTVKIGKCCQYVAKVSVKFKDCKECLDIVSKETYCKNGIYYAYLCFTNNSSHVANNINLISTTPGITYSPSILTPLGGLLPSQTYCATIAIGGPNATNGALVCLKAMLVEIKNCQQSWFCISKDDFCFKLPNCPPPPCQWNAMVKDSTLTICKGASTTLSAYTLPAVAGVTYNWTSSSASVIVGGTTANPTVTPSANPTVYTVTITDNSITGTVCVKTAKVTVYLKDCPPPIPCDSVSVNFNPNTITICLGDSVQLNPITNPVTGLTYLWTPSTGLSNSTIKNPWAKPLVTTTYNLIISYGPNCKKDGSMTVVVKPCSTQVQCEWRAMVKDSAVFICRGTSAILGAYTMPVVAGAMYSWTSTPASTIVNGNTTTPIVTPMISPTVYTVTISVVNSDGTVCTKTAKVTVYWKDCSNPIGTRVAADENTDEITVSPNPTQSVISVQIPDSFNWQSATLINQQGVILNEQDRTDEAKSVKFNVQTQPSGMYIIRVKTDKGFVNKKVMKE